MDYSLTSRKTKNKREINEPKKILFIFCLFVFTSCAADPTFVTQNSNLTTPSSNQDHTPFSGVHLNFRNTNFYSLTSPNPNTQCAGDANSYDHHILTTPIQIARYDNLFPLKLPLNPNDLSTTLYPTFIKNISVDLTNTNSNFPSNYAYSCSLGDGTNSPSTSSCAIFDYGSINGIYTNFGNSLFLIGGDPNLNTSIFTVGINSPGIGSQMLNDESVSNPNFSSSWSNLASLSNYNGPKAFSGASAAYDSQLNKIVIFGGATPSPSSIPPTFSSGEALSGLGPKASGISNNETWTFDLKTQKWLKISLNSVVNSSLLLTQDETIPLNKPNGGRALFGYTSVSGIALSQLTDMGALKSGASVIDLTDRIVTLGGYGPCEGDVCADTHSFNPTYGPEYFDAYNPKSAASSSVPQIKQWIDSYYMKNLSNTYYDSQTGISSSYIASTFATTATLIIKKSVNFGMVSLNNNNPDSNGVGVSSLIIGQNPSSTLQSTPGSGYLAVAGGFLANSVTATNEQSACTAGLCGNLDLFLKWFKTWDDKAETSSSNFSFVTNQIDSTYGELTPGKWIPVKEGASASEQTPWFGGSVMLRGINVPLPPGLSLPGNPPQSPSVPDPSGMNQVVYFGGSDCRNYLTTSSARSSECQNWPQPGNPGRYWAFGYDPASAFYGGTTNPTVIPMNGTPPTNVGMAAARGLDLNGNPIIVAWGGMFAPGQFDTTNTLYYLYNKAGVPTWGKYTVPGINPSGAANSALVYSHVIQNFYLFGGYNYSSSTTDETWQLSLSSNTPSCGASLDANPCQFVWTPLNTAKGMTCYPNCPHARRGHRMVEANYNYFNAPFEPVCKNPALPCSFGIFMEGGTADGLTYFSDRWMFDPTANHGNGHWQQMPDLPPRSLAAMSSVSYTLPASSIIAPRILLFGGETGMQNPIQKGNYFVPPTLGDTWMFDSKNNSWNRVKLYGHRYLSQTDIDNLSDEIEARSATVVSNPTSKLLSPPPLSGAIMVTRTLKRENHSVRDIPKNLVIPEVFLIGGRKKDGTFQLLNNVFKFCAGSTGEKALRRINPNLNPTDDATCDSYDPDTNPNSLSPSLDYVGAWLNKSPQGTLSPDQETQFDATSSGAYLGAAAYDSSRDLIVLYGGLTPKTNPSTAAITDENNFSINTAILEYTPPSKTLTGINSNEYNGTWQSLSACSESPSPPTGRYGHSMVYDPNRQSLFITGGYDLSGHLLAVKKIINHITYVIPEMWVATRIDTPVPNGMVTQNIPPLSEGPFPCYYWQSIDLSSDTISFSVTNNNTSSVHTPTPQGIANAASLFIPASGYNTGYYTTFDNSCVNSGPIATADTSLNKLLAGGVYFDLNRTLMGSNENLILNLTFIPLGQNNLSPGKTLLASTESAIFRIHLIKTGQSGDSLRSVIQPRFLTYSAIDEYPITAQNISVFAPSVGQIRQEQVFIPLSLDPGIDRIRLERYSGNAILIDATLFRLGAPPQ